MLESVGNERKPLFKKFQRRGRGREVGDRFHKSIRIFSSIFFHSRFPRSPLFSWGGMQGRPGHMDVVIDVDGGSSDRRSPSLSPRKGGGNHASSSSASFRPSDRNDRDRDRDLDLLRPESASLLPSRRPPTFDGVSVVAEVMEDATPSKRLRGSNNNKNAGGESGDGGGSERKRTCLSFPPWAGGALHLTTAVVGVGILGLPRALVDLGWPGGVAFMVVATAVSLYTALLLVELCAEGGGGGGGGVEEREERGSSSAAAASSSSSSRSPPPTPELLPLSPLPPSSMMNGSSSSGVGRRGSNQDLQTLAEAEARRKQRKKEERSKREGGAAAATTATATKPSSSLSPSSSANRYETYSSLAEATLGPRMGGAVASMQLLACAG
jgi:hypothetical protein